MPAMMNAEDTKMLGELALLALIIAVPPVGIIILLIILINKD